MTEQDGMQMSAEEKARLVALNSLDQAKAAGLVGVLIAGVTADGKTFLSLPAEHILAVGLAAHANDVAKAKSTSAYFQAEQSQRAHAEYARQQKIREGEKKDGITENPAAQAAEERKSVEREVVVRSVMAKSPGTKKSRSLKAVPSRPRA